MKDDFKIRFWVGFGVIIGSAIAAGAAFYYFSGAIQAQAGKIVTEKAAQASEAGAVANLAALEDDAPQAASYEAAIDKLLPDQQGLIGFGPWVQRIAGKYGVTATVSYQGDPVPSSAATPGTAAFSMTAEGLSGNMEPFLDDLTSKEAGFVISFTSFSYTNSGGRESIEAQGTSYFR